MQIHGKPMANPWAYKMSRSFSSEKHWFYKSTAWFSLEDSYWLEQFEMFEWESTANDNGSLQAQSWAEKLEWVPPKKHKLAISGYFVSYKSPFVCSWFIVLSYKCHNLWVGTCSGSFWGGFFIVAPMRSNSNNGNMTLLMATLSPSVPCHGHGKIPHMPDVLACFQEIQRLWR